MTGDEIVISGIAGKFPNCENIKELQKNLLNQADCVTDSNARWEYENPQIPSRIGIMKEVDKFDSLFFGIHGKLASHMDPMYRILIETAYEAIVDSGINPRELKGSKSAVFTGSTFIESERDFLTDRKNQSSFGLQGVSRALLANRISFFFDFTGPSSTIDSSCCGGATALQEGYRAIKDGRAENAVIGVGNIVLLPNMSLQMFLLGLLSPDGITKSFDNAADGYTRSECIAVIFLQKARNAKRIYAEIQNARMNYGDANNDNSFFYATHNFQAGLMQTVLSECGLKGKDISYVEADGSGIKDVDAEEVQAIDNVYNEGRKSPLLIGSVKSNIGSCSAANPINGIIKVITAMESGYIPPNLHFKQSSDRIPALTEGRCKVVTELTPWTGDYAVVNCLSLTGSAANVILKDFKKQKKNEGRPDDNLSRLVTISGRTEEAVDFMLTELEGRPIDVEMLQLMYDVFKTEIPAHMYRGFTLLPPKGLPKNKIREIQLHMDFKREIWYMFSGMGSQWVGMGKDLLHIPVFAEAISKCNKVLQPHGIDIVRIITEEDSKMFDNIVNSFVGIAAIQIGLVDILSAIGLKPDFLIGHSVGELGCAYADNCFTAEQMILSAYYRGLASVETDMPKGSMAAVGLGYEEIKKLCPPDIDVACHNSENSSTISGPADSMKAFVAYLTEKNIFAKEVAVSNIAYHSRYIAPAGEKLRKYLQLVIPNPKARSKRWLSSSVPRKEWNSVRARLSSAEYHTNNLLSPVLFAETAKNIPSNAIVIEIAPHGLLQAIVKKSLPENVSKIPLTKKNHPDNVSFLFDALGKIYIAGCNINMSNLYPKITYPVSRGTPSISSLIKWDHSIKWYTKFYTQEKNLHDGEINFIINLKEDEWKYLKHARVNDKIIVHTSVYLNLVWKVLKLLKNNSEFSVVYNDVKIHKHDVEIREDESITLVVMVLRATGYFEVSNNKILLCSGIVQASNTSEEEFSPVSKNADNDYQDINISDVYTDLQNRGLQYSGPFRTICKASANATNGTLMWKNDWTTFLEGMIQMYVLGNKVRKAQVPIKIRRIVINMKLQKEALNKSSEIPVTVSKKGKTVTAGGIQMEGIELKFILNQSRKNGTVAEKLYIVPCTDGASSSLLEILRTTYQFLNDNSERSNLIRIIHNKTDDVEEVNNVFQNVIESRQDIKKFKVEVVASSEILMNKSEFSDIALLVLFNVEQQTLKDLLSHIIDGSFILTLAEPKNETSILSIADSAGLGLVLRKYSSNNQVVLLFRRIQTAKKMVVLEINDEEDWSTQVETKLNSEDCDRLIIAIKSKECSNLSKILDVLHKEQKLNKIQIVDIQDPSVSKFSIDDSFFRSHMNLNMKLNVLLPGKIWGIYQHFPISSNCRHVSNWIARQQNGSDLESISWVEGLAKNDKNTIKVEYSTVNQQDIFLATTQVALEDPGKQRLETKLFGQEYSGIDFRGNKVMGISSDGSFSNSISSDADYIWKVPDNWSLEDAVTVPLVYTIAYLSVVIKGELKSKHSVFVYDGCCSIGQAVLNLAANIKSHVFVGYANSNAKRFLENNYPHIPKNCLISTSGSFVERTLSRTGVRALKIVIYNGNDLSEIRNCSQLIKRGGKFIVIGNLHDSLTKSVGILFFEESVSISSIIPSNIIRLDLTTKRKLSQMMVNGIETGIVKPLPKRVYSREMLTKAFIDGASKTVFEKIIVKIQPDDGGNEILAISRFICKSDGSYLIIEGFSDFGLELVEFLVTRGAKNIHIVSESKNTTAYINQRINLWRSYGVSVAVHAELDLFHQQSMIELFKEARKYGTIDAIFDLQRIENLSSRSSSSKHLITKYAFEESKQFCSNLRGFFIFSACKNIEENVNDLLMREIYLTKIFQEKSEKTFPGLLILLGPVTGIANCTTEDESSVPFLSIPGIIEQLDNIFGLNVSIVLLSGKISEERKETFDSEKVAIEETENSKFVKYITDY
ncbi:fatty acid synthase-like [Leptopilina boulardi]|uniref:fatty acid synthase-like n=1 Tax=Leptopilina boulardi TaxID=63433 RepID=UPI0021F573C2|nr:fatty acid synthase-like [Leptopilina boulardi]